MFVILTVSGDHCLCTWLSSLAILGGLAIDLAKYTIIDPVLIFSL